MKKIFAAALATVLFASAALAHTSDNKAIAAHLLKKDFPAAQINSVKETSDYTVVNFTLDKQDMQAFYNNEGKQMATSRAIQLQTLPLNASQALASKYAGYQVTEAIEYNDAETGITYYVSVQNASQRLVLQADTDGTLSVFKKTVIK